jgi:hypothetical protein
MKSRVTPQCAHVRRHTDTSVAPKLSHLPRWLQAALNSCPRRPRKGIHPWLYRISRQLHYRMNPEEVFRLLWLKTRNVGRNVSGKEIAAQIESAAHTAWKPGGHRD